MKTDAELLADMLAVIHRDGGHYQHDHGTQKATADAIIVVLMERQRTEEITEQRDNLEWKLKQETK